MKTKDLVLLELHTDSDSPMIGTLLAVKADSLTEFTERLSKVLSEHFDADEVELINPEKAFETIFTKQVVEIGVRINNYDYVHNIQILETFIY